MGRRGGSWAFTGQVARDTNHSSPELGDANPGTDGRKHDQWVVAQSEDVDLRARTTVQGRGGHTGWGGKGKGGAAAPWPRKGATMTASMRVVTPAWRRLSATMGPTPPTIAYMDTTTTIHGTMAMRTTTRKLGIVRHGGEQGTMPARGEG